MKECLIFDVDGTLWDACDNILIAQNEVISKELGIDNYLNMDILNRVMGLELEEIARVFFPQLEEKYAIELTNKGMANEAKYLSEHGGNMYDQVPETLEELSKKYRLFIITNGVKSTQDGRFGISPITKYFEKIFISEVIGAEKPSKVFFDAVENGIEGYCREKAIVIGDSLSSDIKGALNAGIDCIWYNPIKKEAPEGWQITHIVESFEEILEILK